MTPPKQLPENDVVLSQPFPHRERLLLWHWRAVDDSTWVNDELKTLFGFSGNIIRPSSEWAEKIHPDDSDRVIRGFERALEGRPEGWSDRFRIKLADGRYMDTLVRGSVVYGENHEILGMVGMHLDLERERKAEEMRIRLAAIAESSYDGIIGTDLNGIVNTWNAGAQRIYGYTAEEILGRSVNILVPAELRPGMALLIGRIQAGERVVDYRTKRLKKDGSLIDAQMNFSNIVSHDGELLGLSATVRDVTESKRQEEALLQTTRELARSNAELEQYAYVISHDLKEPIRTVASFVNLLARNYDHSLDERAHEYIEFAVDGAKRMIQLIDDLLKYSRVYRQGAEMREIGLGSVVNEAFSLNRAVLDRIGATVEWSQLPTVQGDRAQLVQLFHNLIDNAIKFRGPRPLRVQIASERAGEKWRFRVSDNGIGIEREHLERIFMVFQRLHGREEYPGTGIGLALCYRIVERHGGHIWAESTPGEGSRFCFTLKAIDERPVAE